MKPGNITISASLVRYLRRGVKRELSATLTILAIQVENVLDPDTYRNVLARFYDAEALFEAVGVTDEPESLEDLKVDLDRWPRLVLRALESEYDIELMRLQDASAEGFELPLRDVPALGSLVADIRKKVGAPPRRVVPRFYAV